MDHTILIVDDEPYVRSSLKRGFELRNEPYTILDAGSAREALVILEAKTVDLVIADQDMPGMLGTELLAEVHTKYPDTVRYMLTGQGTLDVAIKAINSGAVSRFFTKPCIIVDLAASIRQSLEHKELMAAANQLLKTVKKQATELERLERQHPGITNVEMDHEGFITIINDDISIEELLYNLRCKAARAEN
jgi:DNA-binding NtrC family response regulator